MKKIIITLIALTHILFCHDMWLDDTATVHYGHKNIAQSHGDNKILLTSEIQSNNCLVDGSIVAHESSQNCDALFVQVKPTYYTKTPYGTKHQPKNETKMAISSFLSIESVKRINNDNGIATFNKGLEITLRNKPSIIEVGDKARLLLLFQGKAKSDVRVANGDRVIGVSDEDGYVNVRIKEKGLQNIKASFEEKGDGVKCDKTIYATTLNFEVNK